MKGNKYTGQKSTRKFFSHVFFFICAHAVGQVFLICGRPKFFKHAVAIENGHRGIKTEIVTKVVPVRAVDLSIGPFCAEFRCEQLFDEDIFREGGQLFGARNRAPKLSGSCTKKCPKVAPRHKHRNGHENGSRESCGPLDRTILHRISARTFS